MTHRFFTKRWHSIALVAVVAMSMVAFGCDKTENNSVTNPNPNNLNPTGSIQGRLLDSSTGEPVVGAFIDIGVGTATTNQDGVFTIMNVPATSNANGNPEGAYVGLVNLKDVTSPVKMNDPTYTGFKYPKTFAFSAEVVFSSFRDTQGGGAAGSGSGSNHDTPITGLVADLSLSVGKLASNIDGLVVNNNAALTPVGAGYTVNLLISGVAIDNTTTDANGRFLFRNLQSHTHYTLSAFDSGRTKWGDLTVETPADGKTLVLQSQSVSGSDLVVGPPVKVNTTDQYPPKVLSTSPGSGADIPDNTALVFQINFTEPIANTTAYATALTPGASIVAGLWKDVTVNFDGAKAGNIVHSIAWASPTQLAITFPTLSPSSKYSVTLACNALVNLKDLNGNPLLVPSTPCYPGGGSPGHDDFIRRFTTSTAGTAAAPTAVVVVNASSINFDTTTANLDWPPATGAFAYNIYRSKVVKLGGYTGSEAPQAYQKIGTNVAESQFADTAANPYVSGQNQVLYRYKVVSLNSDLNESAESAPVTAADVVPVRLTSPSTAFRTDYLSGDNKLKVVFNEPVDEVSAEVAANYSVVGYNGTTLIASTPVSAFMEADLVSVTLTLASAMDNNAPFRTNTTPHILSGANGVCQYTLAGDDVQVIPNGQGVYDNSICLIADNTASPAAITLNNAALGLAADDFVLASDNTVRSGADGRCNTTVQTGWHLGSIAVGNGTPDSICARAGANLVLDSTLTPGGDDTAVHPVIVTVTGVRDVAGNAINNDPVTGLWDQLATDLVK